MDFTYDGYRALLALLRKNQYQIATYGDYSAYPRSVILRHDIDNSPVMAAKLSDVERSCGVKATYFVLLSTDFYNTATLS